MGHFNIKYMCPSSIKDIKLQKACRS